LPYLPFGASSDAEYLNIIAQEYALTNSIESMDGTASSSASISPTPDPNLPHIRNRLLISKAKVDMPLFAGSDVRVLSKGGWIFPNTSTPDQGGNTVIFGHRVRYLPPVSNTFYSLDAVNVGDTFVLTWNGVAYQYRVITTKVIEPTDLSVLAQDHRSLVTIITCTPLFSTSQRLVVVGELISR
jgi:sortase A